MDVCEILTGYLREHGLDGLRDCGEGCDFDIGPRVEPVASEMGTGPVWPEIAKVLEPTYE